MHGPAASATTAVRAVTRVATYIHKTKSLYVNDNVRTEIIFSIVENVFLSFVKRMNTVESVRV